jgi:hypothetical protein
MEARQAKEDSVRGVPLIAADVQTDKHLYSKERVVAYTKLQGRIIRNPSATSVGLPPSWCDIKEAYRNVATSPTEPIYTKQVISSQGKLQLLAVTRRSETVSLTVNDFRPFFYISKPKDATIADASSLRDQWNQLELPPPPWERKKGLAGGGGSKQRFRSTTVGQSLLHANIVPRRQEDPDDEQMRDGDTRDKPKHHVVDITEEWREPAIGFSYGLKDCLWKVRFDNYAVMTSYRELFHKQQAPVTKLGRKQKIRMLAGHNISEILTVFQVYFVA